MAIRERDGVEEAKKVLYLIKLPPKAEHLSWMISNPLWTHPALQSSILQSYSSLRNIK